MNQLTLGDCLKVMRRMESESIQMGKHNIAVKLIDSETYGTLNYTLENSDNISIEIYDILGKKISILQNGYMEKGNQKLRYNFDGLNPGTY